MLTLLVVLLLLGLCRELWRHRSSKSIRPKASPVTQLSRKWGRAMFHMGYISIEELCWIYEQTPPEHEVTEVNLQGPPPAV